MAQLRKFRFAAITSLATAALVGGLTTLPAEAAPAEGKVLAADSPTAIKDSYIVTLKKGSTGFKSTSAAGKNLVKEYGGAVKKTFGTALNGYSATLSAAEAKRLAADPAVASVEQNQRVHVDATQPSAPWGLDRIDQAALPLSGTYTYPDTAGAGVTAYVIDTGVRITHAQISGRASYGYDAVDGDTTASDGNGHGTHVATTIAGSTAGVIAGIDRVTNNHSGPSVANLSLHGGASSTLDTAVRNSIASGVTYAVAAGNSSANASSYSPARVTEAITVGATTSTDARAGYSHYGSVPDVFAPGSSTHVAGAAAVCFAGHTSATPAQVATARVSGATSNVVTSPGTGSPDKFLKIVP